MPQQALNNQRTQTTSTVETINLSAGQKNPYPALNQLRIEHPIYHDQEKNCWYLSRYTDVNRALTDKILLKNHPELNHPYPIDPNHLSPFDQLIQHWLVFKDPPKHTQIRALLTYPFTPKNIEKLKSHITTLATDLVNNIKKNGQETDLIESFTYPLPIKVICHMIGVPQSDWPIFRKWSEQMANGLERTNPEEDLKVASIATKEAISYFKELLKNKQITSQNNLINHLINAPKDQQLTQEEILSTCIFILMSGHETTVNLIANAITLLKQNPKQYTKLKQNPQLIKTAIEECLRLEPPILMPHRWTQDTYNIGAQSIPPNSMLILLLGAANRDPNQFEAPNTMDITRTPNPHLSFGKGIHFCLGATLSRLESQIAINTLLQNTTQIELDTNNLQWRDLIAFRALKALPAVIS